MTFVCHLFILGFGLCMPFIAKQQKLILWAIPLTFLLGALSGHVHLTQGAPYVFAVLCGCFFLFFKTKLTHYKRFFVGLVCFALSQVMLWRLVPGLDNFYVGNMTLKEGSIPLTLWWNIDKPLLSILILGLVPFSKLTLQKWRTVTVQSFPIITLCALCLIPLALLSQMIRWSPGLPAMAGQLLIRNLIFVVIAEEIFYRFFLQNALYDLARHFKLSPWWALAAITLLFAVCGHASGGPLYAAFAGIAGFFYGYAYHTTKRIEAAIIVHFSINVLHMLLFTYPLAK